MRPKCLEDKEIIVRVPRAYPHEGQELIRCKDCKHYASSLGFCGHEFGLDFVSEDGYCCQAERKEEWHRQNG